MKREGIMKRKVLDQFLSQLGIREIVSFQNQEGKYSSGLNFDVQKKLELINPDALYLFNNQPLILFFDLSDNTDKKREDDIHKKVWSFDNSPIAFIIKNDDIKVYNALNYVKEDNKLEELDLNNEQITEKFSFWNLQSNKIWEWFQKEYITANTRKNTRKRANERLFQNIKDVRHALIEKEKDAEGSIPNSLILRLIFIRYLIDRNVEIDHNFIMGADIQSKRISFSNLIKDYNRLSQLFVKLNDRFNGVLFKDVDIELTPTQADALSDVFRGEKPEKGTLFYGSDFYFDIFDFSIIPVEVISGIYESLIDPETRDLQSAVYTPSFLVEYILNDTVDVYLEQNNTSECKIFEVAVGSGIFLVQALRRMIEKEIALHGNSDKKVFSERIREIAKQNLYGIDINKEALKVTCFSIYIALLDYQEPKNISAYLFPDLLNGNLFEANFFNTNHTFNQIIKTVKPSYILGNPPWKSSKDAYHIAWLKAHKKTVGGFEIAQSFLLRTKDFMERDTKVMLIVTSTAFYNVSTTAKKFKKEFLTTFCLHKFFDLAPVRRLIFEEKDSPASIVFYQLSENNEHLKNVVSHQSIKMNYFLKHFKMFVIEKFDKKEIPQQFFIKYDWMFKVALYGNTLDFNLIKKLQNNRDRLIDFIDNKTLHGGAGILKGTPKNHFDFLIGLPFNKNAQIKQYYTPNSTYKLTHDDVYLESGRTLSLFDGSKILMKEQAMKESELVVSYNAEPSVFKKGVFGICSRDDNAIRKLYGYLISDVFTYYVFCVAGSWATSTRPQIRWKEEFLSFPIAETTPEIKSRLKELVDEFIQPYEKYYETFNMGQPHENKTILSEINHIVHELYDITEYERDQIDYVLKVSRYQFQESKIDLITNFTENDKEDYRNRDFVTRKYAEVYLQEFEKVYPNENIQIEIYLLDHFIAMNFVFHTNCVKEEIIYPEDKNTTEVLKRLANNISVSQITSTTDPEKNLFIQKNIYGFEKNSFYIIKPNEYKCWHRAIAWYDIAEFKARIEEAELTHLNGKEK